MRIFLTGGHGMVGRNFLLEASKRGHEVIAPSRNQLDLRDYKSLIQYLKASSPDVVIHSAGRVGGIQANIKEPVNFLIDNLDIGRNVVLASRELNIKHLLNLGSSCMYPRDAINPLTEEMILKGELEPTNEGYALAKVMISRLCNYISTEDSDFNYKTLIPCNIFGLFDKFDPKHSHLVPSIIHKLHQAKLTGAKKVEIWGSGEARREFMFATDLASCMSYAIENFDAMPSNLNCGLGFDYSVNEYYAVAAKVIGYDGEFVHDLTKPEGMKQKLVSTEKLNAFGWKSNTSLELGIKLTYEHYLNLKD